MYLWFNCMFYELCFMNCIVCILCIYCTSMYYCMYDFDCMYGFYCMHVFIVCMFIVFILGFSYAYIVCMYLFIYSLKLAGRVPRAHFKMHRSAGRSRGAE
jgi:hypothetical protein